MPLETPSIPSVFNAPQGDAFAFAGFPVRVEISAAVLVVVFVLAALYAVALSVILVYHWRRFPFEHELFVGVERFYVLGQLVFLGCALVAILMTL